MKAWLFRSSLGIVIAIADYREVAVALIEERLKFVDAKTIDKYIVYLGDVEDNSTLAHFT